MFKKILLVTALIVIVGGLVFGAVNRTLAKSSNEGTGQGGNERINAGARSSTGQTGVEEAQGQGNGGNGSGRGQGENGNQGNESTNLPPATPGELSDAEAAALLYMREEEKLAHDVYVTFYNQWGQPVFQNISQSEQTHTEAVKALLDRYGLADPASSTVGIFTNPHLQELYNDLVSRGSQSLSESTFGLLMKSSPLLCSKTASAQVARREGEKE